jgi:hypothetical protein
MKTPSLIFALCFVYLSMKAQDGWTTKSFDVASSFTEIVATSGVNLKIKEGTTNSLTYACNNKESLELVTVENVKNRVTISMKNQKSSWGKNIKCEGNLTIAKDPTYIESSHGSNLSFSDIDVSNLTIISTDGSNLEGSLKGSKVNIESKAGSNLKLLGSASNIECTATGGSNLDTRKLSAKDCIVYAKHGSNASVNATGNVTADAKQGSNITVLGNKSNVVKSKDNSSNISTK